MSVTKCTKGCGRDVPTATRGLVGSARIAGLCWPCFKKEPGANSGPAPKDPAPRGKRTGPALVAEVERLVAAREKLLEEVAQYQSLVRDQLADTILARKRLATKVKALEEIEASARAKTAKIEAAIREEAAEFAALRSKTRKAEGAEEKTEEKHPA